MPVSPPPAASAVPDNLPALDVLSARHALRVAAHLRRLIAHAPDRFLPFELWMDQALYAPGLGYYAAGSTKFGGDTPSGDFTTAPELTPLFGRTLSRQVEEILRLSDSAHVLEFGAGSGALAASLIPALRAQGVEPRYLIMEVSADLRQRQRERLAPLEADIAWLDAPPRRFHGCVVANEVLDAMPACLFVWDEDGQVRELGVGLGDNRDFVWLHRAAPPALEEAVRARMPCLPGYQSEVNLRAEAWVRGLGDWLEKGAALLLDYGMPRREYYHPQRAQGTLMCHFRHHAHDRPLIHPGLQDITTHVDFTAMADAALAGGLDVLGYASQARFLMNAGLLTHLSDADPRTLSAVQKLVSEAEMGELFKVLALGRDIGGPLSGFLGGDRRGRL
jgi:SAM-dependent MidA family methyltransferase